MVVNQMVTQADTLLKWGITKTRKIGDAEGINHGYQPHFPKSGYRLPIG